MAIAIKNNIRGLLRNFDPKVEVRKTRLGLLLTFRHVSEVRWVGSRTDAEAK